MHRNRSFSSPKIARDLRQKLAVTADEATLPVIVRYRDAARISLPKAPGLQVTRVYHLLPAIAARLPAREVQTLASDDTIERIWLDFTVHATLDVSAPAVGANIAWESRITGQGIQVAILDTGIDPEHPDFGDRIVAASNYLKVPSVGQPDSWNKQDRSAIDGNGHGTHVAGIVAGNGAASDGLYRGIAPEATLLVAKVLDDSGAGEASDVIAGLEWAFDKGAQVACLSLGSDEAGDGTDALSVACDELVERGLIICVAAGNAGPRPYTIGPPACARQVITVGAADLTRRSSGIVTVAGFSSRGPTSDRRTKPDIVFPGVGIASCRALQGHIGEPVDRFTEYYVRTSGTSMAAPFAAGTCALLLQESPESTPKQIKELLCQSAKPLNEDANAQGSGLGNVARSLEFLRDLPLPEPAEPEPAGCLWAFLSWLRSVPQVATKELTDPSRPSHSNQPALADTALSFKEKR